jgi:hypothetical protein
MIISLPGQGTKEDCAGEHHKLFTQLTITQQIYKEIVAFILRQKKPRKNRLK